MPGTDLAGLDNMLEVIDIIVFPLIGAWAANTAEYPETMLIAGHVWILRVPRAWSGIIVGWFGPMLGRYLAPAGGRFHDPYGSWNPSLT